MSERFKVTKFDDPSGKTYKNYGATSAENDVELKGKLLPDSGAHGSQQRIVGGSTVQISQYPSLIGLLYSPNGVYYNQYCAGALLNSVSVLTAASCTYSSTTNQWQLRAGSSNANSGGTVYFISQIINHPNYSHLNPNNDIAIVKSLTTITYVNLAVQPATFAGASYTIPDGATLYVAGWGVNALGIASEALLHTSVSALNQQTCTNSFGLSYVKNTMLCTSKSGVGQCFQDFGSPVYHNGFVVGVTTSMVNCGSYSYPTINTRVSSFITWIQANA